MPTSRGTNTKLSDMNSAWYQPVGPQSTYQGAMPFQNHRSLYLLDLLSRS